MLAVGAVLVLLAANAFFALAEFAVVRVRPTRVAELARSGDRRALALARIHEHLDDYLSVVQVGITCAGVGLGLVLDQGLAEALAGAIPGEGAAPRVASLALAFLLGTYLSVVFGELVPKALAIRDAERLALRCALPLRFFHALFWLPLKVLSGSARGILFALGYRQAPREPLHTERELRSILGASQEGGVMSFRRLLMIENVFDLGTLTVGDAMRPRAQAQALAAGTTEERVLAVVREHRFSRYPLVDPSGPPDAMPVGVVHVKDLFARDRAQAFDLRALARPYLTFTPQTPLEQALVEFQRTHRHLAMVRGAAGAWEGVLALEDVLEEVIGQIHDEFDRDPQEAEDALRACRVLVEVPAASFEELRARLVAGLADADLPRGTDRAQVLRQLEERERSLTTYVGRGIALPHARVPGLERPLVVFARPQEDLPVEGTTERLRVAFLLLTPASSPRAHVRLLARIAALVESEYVAEVLREGTAEQVAEAISTGAAIASS